MAPRNLTPSERDRVFGPLVIASVSGRDTVTFEQDPPLVNVDWGGSTVRVHELAAPSLRRVAESLRDAGLLDDAVPIVGYQPRLVRTAGGGNRDVLSAHAYGAAVDVRFDRLPQGSHTDEKQRAIAPHFEREGWFWGERFQEPDPHHFAFEGPPGVPGRGSDDDVVPDPGTRAAATIGVLVAGGVWLAIMRLLAAKR